MTMVESQLNKPKLLVNQHRHTTVQLNTAFGTISYMDLALP